MNRMVVNKQLVDRKLREAIRLLQESRRMMTQINDSDADADRERTYAVRHFSAVDAADGALTRLDIVFFQ